MVGASFVLYPKFTDPRVDEILIVKKMTLFAVSLALQALSLLANLLRFSDDIRSYRWNRDILL